MRPWTRRGTLLAALCIASGLLAGPALAGSYLSRAAMLLAAGEVEASALRRRYYDKELAKAVHRLALHRVAAAREMEVPKEVVRAHPHLLLVLEAYERAADAALRGAQEDFLVALAKARAERSTFDSVLAQLGWTLPKS